MLTRGGHTEATIDLVTLAGFKPAGVLCELTNDDGTMARAPECITFARLHNMPVVTIEDLVEYRRAHGAKPAEHADVKKPGKPGFFVSSGS